MSMRTGETLRRVEPGEDISIFQTVMTLLKAKIRQTFIENVIFNCCGCRCFSFLSLELLYWRPVM